MSIRSRFTMLYTFILALTLAIFGIALYILQARNTLNSLKQDLSLTANRLAEAALRSDSFRALPKPDQFPPIQPIPFDEFSTEQEFQSFPERVIGRILDAEGSLITSPFGREEDALPLSDKGLTIVQNQGDWYENAIVSGDEMLIYSRPVIVKGEVVYIVQVAHPLTERNRTLQSLATTFLIAGSLTVLIAFGIGWVLSGITLQPIHRITQTAQKIGDDRDFNRRVDYAGPSDEVGQLANTFNSMLSRLQDAFQKVEHSLQMQRDFVADISHELRTPLTTLRGNLGLLRRDPPMPLEEATDVIADMVEESDRLIRLVNSLLLLTQADTGRYLAKEPVDISSILNETCRQAHQLDLNRQIQLDLATDLTALGDRDAMKQVFLIALDNALKHSTGNIIVTAKRNDEGVEIRVKDFGEGIAPENLERLFNRFYRGDATSTSPGFGLGLAIAKALVTGMGGEISLESKIGEGSTVIMRLGSAN